MSMKRFSPALACKINPIRATDSPVHRCDPGWRTSHLLTRWNRVIPREVVHCYEKKQKGIKSRAAILCLLNQLIFSFG